jgi:hypothetical protein
VFAQLTGSGGAATSQFPHDLHMRR